MNLKANLKKIDLSSYAEYKKYKVSITSYFNIYTKKNVSVKSSREAFLKIMQAQILTV